MIRQTIKRRKSGYRVVTAVTTSSNDSPLIEFLHSVDNQLLDTLLQRLRDARC